VNFVGTVIVYCTTAWGYQMEFRQASG